MLWLQPGKQQEIDDQAFSLQGPLTALPNGGLCQGRWGDSHHLCTGYKTPCSQDMPLPESSEAAQRFPACQLLPAWVLHASRALLHARYSGGVPPRASAATARAGFSPCPKLSWLRVINPQRGDAPTSRNSCERLSRVCEQTLPKSCGPCSNKAISMKPEAGGQCLAKCLHWCCLAFAGVRSLTSPQAHGWVCRRFDEE